MRTILAVVVAMLALSCVDAQSQPHSPASPTGDVPPNFIPTDGGPGWWPPTQFVDGSGELLPNPGASPYSFQFNGAVHGQNYVTLPRSLSAVLPRGFTAEAWIYLPSIDDVETTNAFLPI